jgi:Lon-like ATP-dependent protease
VLAIPLTRRPLFPGVLMPVTVDDPALVSRLAALKREGGQAYVGAFLRRGEGGEGGEEGGGTHLFSVGTLAQVHAIAIAHPPSSAPDRGGARGGARGGPGAEALSSSSSSSSSDDDDKEEDGGAGGSARSSSSGKGAPLPASGEAAPPRRASAQLLLLGHRRVVRVGPPVASDPLTLTVAPLRDDPYDATSDELRATALEAVATLKDLLTMHPLYNEQLKAFASAGGDFHDAARLADVGASLTSAPGPELQVEVLEQTAVPARASAALLLLKKEVELCRLQADIGRRVEEKITADQRRYFLMEQLKSIKKELGLERDDRGALVAKFRGRLAEREARPGGVPPLPPPAAGVIEDELAKLGALDPASSEFAVTRNYLDWLTSLPWGASRTDTLDVASARAVLDADHYGLADVKDRVLEFIAAGALRGEAGATGKILLLAGPPGVGKTSVGRSIARALGRAFYRFSVGGLADVAEVKGHRRTYVGAMPGKAVQCLKATGVSNPLVLIDEVDKLGRGYQGDPASALLELLDPEQNAAFMDHYLDVPLDLSRVLFVCTANDVSAIPPALRDRMETIHIAGYTSAEKVAIARTYLEPGAASDAGVPAGAVVLTDEALAALVEDWCREAGVRNLKNTVGKVYRKAALKLLESRAAVPPVPHEKCDAEEEEKKEAAAAAATRPGAPPPPPHTPHAPASGARGAATLVGEPIIITPSDLPPYIGQPPFTTDRLYGGPGGPPPPPGVVLGLAWTAAGGATLCVEAAAPDRARGKGRLTATGQLGSVMSESATVAAAHAAAFHARMVRAGGGGSGGDGGAGVGGKRKGAKKEGGGSGRAHHHPPSALPPLGPAATALSLAAAADPAFFTESSIHLHVPAGATPKDGPSAGVTVVTALLSLALGTPADPSLAMTGEVTLTGRVLPVGGIKEKVLAAKRAGITRVALPEGNRKDWEELEGEVREGLSAAFFGDYGGVFEAAFGYAAAPTETQD